LIHIFNLKVRWKLASGRSKRKKHTLDKALKSRRSRTLLGLQLYWRARAAHEEELTKLESSRLRRKLGLGLGRRAAHTGHD